jgi:hypothetical protein
MSDILRELEAMVADFGTAPTMEEVSRRTLEDKGIAGPTAAHVIEEVHCPYNLALLTFTTGSTAFQNIVGVTHAEIEDKVKATTNALERAGVTRGAKMLFTYAPLVNVFDQRALEGFGLDWFFLKRSSRDAFLLSLCKDRPSVVVGESSFIRASLQETTRLGLKDLVPRDVVAFTAGTPMDLELLEVAERFGWRAHDLYGCQEFGWLTLDGVPLRDDLSLAPSPRGDKYKELLVGGLPMADSFPVADSGHACDPAGRIITYRRERTNPEYEVVVKATTLNSAVTVERAARTMLRIKSRVVKVHPEVKVSAEATELDIVPSIVPVEHIPEPVMTVRGPEKTRMFDVLVKAQLEMQQTAKTDPAWCKGR